MLVGYNTNISYKDKVYHIQTEDSGKSNPVVLTLLYHQGAILASKKTSYSDIVSNPDYEDAVRNIMREQHKWMIKALLSGKFTGGQEDDKGTKEVPAEERSAEERPAEPPPTEAPSEPLSVGEAQADTKDQITKSLDDILLNYIMKRAKQ